MLNISENMDLSQYPHLVSTAIKRIFTQHGNMYTPWQQAHMYHMWLW